MRRTKIIHDSDFGRIEVPDERISKRAWQQGVRRVRSVLRGRRHWKAGRAYACPVCRHRTFVGRDDLTHEEVRGDKVFVFLRLHGGRCTSCDAQAVEAYEVLDVEDAMGVSFRADYRGKVSRIGRGTLGTYWPKDVERVLGLRPDKKVYIEILGRDAALLRFREAA